MFLNILIKCQCLVTDKDSSTGDSDCLIVQPNDTSQEASMSKRLASGSGALAAGSTLSTVTSGSRPSPLVVTSTESASTVPKSGMYNHASKITFAACASILIIVGYHKGVRKFNYSELQSATSEFANLIGKGGVWKSV